MIICKNTKRNGKVIYDPDTGFYQMAEASVAAFGSAVGVAIAMAVVAFILRGKGHKESLE